VRRFTGVTTKGGSQPGDANVVVDNESVATTTREQVSVPSEGANPIGMAVHGTKLLAPFAHPRAVLIHQMFQLQDGRLLAPTQPT
jgi:hypothetical protein